MKMETKYQFTVNKMNGSNYFKVLHSVFRYVHVISGKPTI